MSKPTWYDYHPHRPFPDGYMDGAETPSDFEMDRSLYPERPEKPNPIPMDPGESWEQYEKRCQEAEMAREGARFQRDRDLYITEGSATGQHTGPPRTPKMQYEEKE